VNVGLVSLFVLACEKDVFDTGFTFFVAENDLEVGCSSSRYFQRNGTNGHSVYTFADLGRCSSSVCESGQIFWVA